MFSEFRRFFKKFVILLDVIAVKAAFSEIALLVDGQSLPKESSALSELFNHNSRNLSLFQLHPTSSNSKFSGSNFKRTTGRPPSGRGDEDCTFDWLLIPGARGNLTRYGEINGSGLHWGFVSQLNWKFGTKVERSRNYWLTECSGHFSG